MKGIIFETFGGPSVLTYTTIDDPHAKPGEVLVRVHGAGVNHLDLDIRAGTSGFDVSPPLVLGREAVGTIVEGGPDARTKVGTNVVVSAYRSCHRCEFCQRGLINLCQNAIRPGIETNGSYAELIRVPEDQVYPVDDGHDLMALAGIQLSFGTAWHGLITRAGIQPGETLLVTGAAGGVGHAAIQLGNLIGARVIAVVGSAEKEAFVQTLNPWYVINYKKHSLVGTVLEVTRGSGVDVVFDGVGGRFLEDGYSAMHRGGRYVLYGAHGGESTLVNLIKVFRSYGTLMSTSGWTEHDLARVLNLMLEKRIRLNYEVVPLEAASNAHRRMEQSVVVGKLILRP